jgi:hypothetical protein
LQKSDAVAVFDTAGALCKLGADECLKQLGDKAMRVIASNVLSLLESGSLDQLPTIVEDMRFIASEQLALDDCPLIALAFASSTALVHPRIEGWQGNLENIHRARWMKIKGV